MKKSLIALALIATAFTAHANTAPTAQAAPAQAAAPAKATGSSVNVTGAWAKEASAPRLTQKGSSVEANFDVMLPVVKQHPQWKVAGQSNKKALVRLAMKSKDGSATLEMDISRELSDQQKVKVGDAISAEVSQGALLVFSKDKVPLGFMVKPGLPVSNLR